MFSKYVLENKNNIINNVCDLITYPSVSTECTNSNYPFGKSCNDVLKFFLNLSNNLGFRTKNIDGYAGYAEFGNGKELIGIIRSFRCCSGKRGRLAIFPIYSYYFKW